MRSAFETQTASWPKFEFRVAMLEEGIQTMGWEHVFSSIDSCRLAMSQYTTIHETVSDVFNAMRKE